MIDTSLAVEVTWSPNETVVEELKVLKQLTASLLALPLLAGCVETAGQLPDRVPVGVDGQEQVCAAAFADQLGTPISSIRVNGRDTSPSGNTVVFLQSADLAARANCEVNDFGNVLSLVSTS